MKELKLEQEMRTALSGNQFEAYYQPIVSLNDNAVYGFETLIRWNHPERGLVSPGEFIPVAERTGMVHLLDEVMLHQACDFLKLMEERDVIHSDTRFSMSTNLSGVNFETIDIVDMIRRAINDKKINPRHLKVEITESALIGDPVMASEVLGDLKKLGVRISLDDFGTGYSSLNYLHKFPIDELKIDRSFVSQINKERKTLDIVRAICSLAQSFKMGLVAEGIERPDEITALYGVGCDIGQGYLFSKPLSRDAALEYVIGHSLVSGT